jgi:hypothetical protein
VTPEVSQDKGQPVGRIGAYVGSPPEFVTGAPWPAGRPVEGAWSRPGRCRADAAHDGQMLMARLSLKNLSGPLTIADYAGKSASMGLTQYLVFLALISVSLGVLNLLPLPVLDGGHLMYYLWEGVTGKSRLRRMDGAPAARWRGAAHGHDVDCAVQRRHPPVWLTGCLCPRTCRHAFPSQHEKTIQPLSPAHRFGRWWPCSSCPGGLGGRSVHRARHPRRGPAARGARHRVRVAAVPCG